MMGTGLNQHCCLKSYGEGRHTTRNLPHAPFEFSIVCCLVTVLIYIFRSEGKNSPRKKSGGNEGKGTYDDVDFMLHYAVDYAIILCFHQLELFLTARRKVGGGEINRGVRRMFLYDHTVQRISTVES